jgi:hypothetical protein
MNDKALDEIQASLARIEGSLNSFTGQFSQHVSDDAAVAADVKALRAQRGFFVTSFVAIGAGIAAAAAYVLKRFN